MAGEKIFENKIKKFLKTLPNMWFFKHWAGPYSTAGIPDIIGCLNGRFIGIEVKADNGHPSPLQLRAVDQINESGGFAMIVYPKDFEELKRKLSDIVNERTN